MKVLLDSCVWGKALPELQENGFDADWTGGWEKDPGDLQILAYAHENGYTLVTLDKDFGELAILRELPHCGIIRLVDLSVKEQGNMATYILRKYEDELKAGAIVTASRERVRVRPGG